MHFFTLVWKNLVRRRLRSALTIGGLAIAVGAVITLVGISRGFERSFLNLYYQRGADLVVQHAGGTMQLNSGIAESLGQQIEVLPGARQVIGGLMDVVALEKYDLFAVIINGWPPDSRVLHSVEVVSGRRLQTGERGRVMLGNVLAENVGKHVGDQLEVYGEEFEIVGIFSSFSVYETGAIFMLLDELQRLMDRPQQVTGFVVQATQSSDPRAVAELKQRIEGLDRNIVATPVPEFVHNISQIRVIRAGAWVTSVIAITVGIIGVLNTMIMSVFERAREIGALRAIGWPRWRVVWMILCESVLLSALGALAGTLLALAAVRILAHWPKVAGFIEGNPAPSVIFLGCSLAMLIGVLGAAYPAYWAARLWPVEAMRR